MPRMPIGIASDHRAPCEWFPALTVAVALALPCPAGADVLVKQKTVSEGLGGFGNASTEGTLIVSGDRSRNEDQVTYTGRFKKMTAENQQQLAEPAPRPRRRQRPRPEPRPPVVRCSRA